MEAEHGAASTDEGDEGALVQQSGSTPCVPGTVHVMSRRYNARPLDCARCPPTIDNVIYHYACTIKPWEVVTTE